MNALEWDQQSDICHGLTGEFGIPKDASTKEYTRGQMEACIKVMIDLE